MPWFFSPVNSPVSSPISSSIFSPVFRPFFSVVFSIVFILLGNNHVSGQIRLDSYPNSIARQVFGRVGK